MTLHTTGFLTILKLIEKDLNNFLFGYSYGCSQDNYPMLRLVGRSESLLVGEKVQNDISSVWTVERVVNIELKGDGISKEAGVEYYNLGEFFAQKQITDRIVESLVKLFNKKKTQPGKTIWKRLRKFLRLVLI